ncbi:S8 family serine peptidase [Staphylococcus agnetis]|uniref:S8 family serine peptidase n=1 Tax=Staphylococcus agnetis TaxID=985762 RepID=UPI00208EFE83|nr:S8 family serine peptidase [Staphylococcus agnetis]MCO4346588.1 S8 family serine peptidase [Staphylococcus agnetis]
MQSPILLSKNKLFSPAVYTIIFDIYSHYKHCINIILKNKIRISTRIDEILTIQVIGCLEPITLILNSLGATISPSSIGCKVLNKNKVGIDENINPKDIQWDVLRTTANYSTHKIISGSHNHCVALIDSGIDVNHQDLMGNIINVKNFVPNKKIDSQENNVSVDPIYMKDYLDHGTQVAGQICANGEITSVTPNTGIRVYRVFGEEKAYNIWIIDAIIHAANDGVDVINLSLGSYLIDNYYSINSKKYNNKAEIEAFKRAIEYAYSKGCVVVGALGNDDIIIDNQEVFLKSIKDNLGASNINENTRVYDFPSQLPNVIGVASANYFDDIANYSNKSKKSIDILSYAGDTRLLEKYGMKKWLQKKLILKDWILSTSSNTVYTYTTGNSLATGKVSGAIAAMNAYYNIHKDPCRSLQLFKDKTSRILNMEEFV